MSPHLRGTLALVSDVDVFMSLFCCDVARLRLRAPPSSLLEGGCAALLKWGVAFRIPHSLVRAALFAFVVPKPGKDVGRFILDATPINDITVSPPWFALPSVASVRSFFATLRLLVSFA